MLCQTLVFSVLEWFALPNNRHLWKVLIFFFHSKKTVAEAHRELQKVYGDAALSETTYRDWFRRFKDGDFNVDDRPREGRSKTFEDADVIYYELLKPNENKFICNHFFTIKLHFHEKNSGKLVAQLII